MTTTDTTSAEEREHKEHTVEVLFNLKPIRLPKETMTGLQIKQSAIEQGIRIQTSYVLFVVKDEGTSRRVIVGDIDEVKVRANLRFAAVADDDNS